jgi:hypothetical protein
MIARRRGGQAARTLLARSMTLGWALILNLSESWFVCESNRAIVAVDACARVRSLSAAFDEREIPQVIALAVLAFEAGGRGYVRPDVDVADHRVPVPTAVVELALTAWPPGGGPP